jgi:hypothetical protein
MNYVPAQRTTTQWWRQKMLDIAAANNLAQGLPGVESNPVSYSDLLPSQLRQQDDYVEFDLPFPISDQEMKLSSQHDVIKRVLQAVENMTEIKNWISQNRVDPHEISIYNIDRKDQRTGLSLFRVKFSVKAPNSVRAPYGARRSTVPM